jgi:hypothetical protein
MKHAKKILCALLAMVMVVALTAVPAFADGDGDGATNTTETTTPTAYTTLAVSEELTQNSGESFGAGSNISIPDVKFVVKIEPDTSDTVNSKIALQSGEVTTDNPHGDTITYTFTGNTAFKQDDKAFNFSGINWKEAGGTGAYYYTVTSTPVNAGTNSQNLAFLANGSNVTTYTLTVMVAMNDAGEYYISQFVVNTGKTKDGEVVKLDSLAFENPTNYETLKITNEVTGTAAEKTLPFNYLLIIPEEGAEDGLTLDPDTTFTATITRRNGDQDTVTLKISDDGTPFTLADGEKLEVQVPVSMIFTVKQLTGADEGYTTHHDFILGSSDNYAFTVQGDCDAETNANADVYNHKGEIGQDHVVNGVDEVNQVNYHNVKNLPTDTGITMDVIPYVMVVMAAAALAVLMVIKKRKTDR